MPQIDDFFIDKNRVDGISEEDYERVQPKIEAVAAAARTTTNSIYIIDYHKRNFLYSSENPVIHSTSSMCQKRNRPCCSKSIVRVLRSSRG